MQLSSLIPMPMLITHSQDIFPSGATTVCLCSPNRQALFRGRRWPEGEFPPTEPGEGGQNHLELQVLGILILPFRLSKKAMPEVQQWVWGRRDGGEKRKWLQFTYFFQSPKKRLRDQRTYMGICRWGNIIWTWVCDSHQPKVRDGAGERGPDSSPGSRAIPCLLLEQLSLPPSSFLSPSPHYPRVWAVLLFIRVSPAGWTGMKRALLA